MTAVTSDPDHVIEELDKGAIELVSFFWHLAYVSSWLIELVKIQLQALGTEQTNVGATDLLAGQ